MCVRVNASLTPPPRQRMVTMSATAAFTATTLAMDYALRNSRNTEGAHTTQEMRTHHNDNKLIIAETGLAVGKKITLKGKKHAKSNYMVLSLSVAGFHYGERDANGKISQQYMRYDTMAVRVSSVG
jgi:hypothetical protein